jgi:WD40 repeat protein
VGVGGLAVLTLVGLAVALAYQSRLQAAYDREMMFLYQNRIVFAERELYDNTPHRADALLDECPPDRRHWEWNYLKRQCHPELLTIAAHRAAIRSLAVSPDGRWIATAAESDEPIRIWDSETGRELWTLPGHRDTSSTFCAFSPDGTRLVSGGRERRTPGQEVIVWDVATGTKVLSIPNLKAGINAVAYSPDGRRIAAGVGNVLQTWDAETGEDPVRYEGHTMELMDVAYSPDGQRLVTTSADRTIRIWDVASGRALQVLQGDKYAPIAVTIHPDARRFASVGMDPTVKPWDFATGQQLIGLRGHTDIIWSVAFSPDGRWIATSDQLGLIKLWNGSPVTGGSR